MSPLEKFLYFKLKKVESELKETKDNLSKTNDALDNSNEELKKLRKDHSDLKVKVGSLEFDLKKIKIRSIYKSIIDIFCNAYDKNLNDNYYNKLNNLLYILEQYEENDKIAELKQFLVDIYYFLQKGNCTAHSIEENLTPLDLIFPLIEKESKQNYSKTKEIFLKLSFN